MDARRIFHLAKRKHFSLGTREGTMKHEYHEGPKAGENFKALASAVFQAKKTTVPAKPKKAARRKASGKDKA
jgi:hypothetical protein